MTQLTDLMSQGFQIQISELVTPDTVFPVVDGDIITLIFHPVNYSYISNEDIFLAHEINMLRINKRIDEMAEEACAKLDRMVDEMNDKFTPKMVQGFFPNTEVIENPDGTFTFVEVGPNVMSFYEPEQSSENDAMTEDEIMKRYG